MALTREDEVVVGDPPVFERATTWSDWAFSVHVFLGATSFARVRRGVVSTDFGCGDWQPRGPASVGRCRRAGSAWLYGNRPRLRPGAEPLARLGGPACRPPERSGRAERGVALLTSAGLEQASPPRAAR